ncbi:hypothetical protein AVEN_126145-1 [Araneus ventricosus]|uniref:Uncharacterized protein n=1 Tax=Araneus ventricosus TaxID=182803 RepID=A0A4Y2KDG0_ARAVE|nr:hypothetical protein AVEN_126145-1 [Araneus ventricosus]
MTWKQSVRSDNACKCMKLSPQANLTVMKRREIISPQQYSAVLEELSGGRTAEESYASDLDGKVTEYIDHETDSDIDMEGNPAHQENIDSYSDINVCIIHPFNL